MVSDTPLKDMYLRVKLFLSSINQTMFCREDEWPEEYVPYYLKLGKVDLEGYATVEDVEERIEPLATKEDVKEFQPNVLYGKIAVFDGDSIGQGSGTDGNWAKVIGSANNMDWQTIRLAAVRLRRKSIVPAEALAIG